MPGWLAFRVARCMTRATAYTAHVRRRAQVKEEIALLSLDAVTQLKGAEGDDARVASLSAILPSEAPIERGGSFLRFFAFRCFQLVTE